jgi:hypothetical protein
MAKIQVKQMNYNKLKREFIEELINYLEDTTVIKYREYNEDSQGNILSEKDHVFKLKDDKHTELQGQASKADKKTYVNNIIKNEDIQAFLNPAPVEEEV